MGFFRKTNKEEQPIALVSHTLSKVENNYSQLEKEALVFGVVQFRIHLLGKEFPTLNRSLTSG